MKEQDTAGGGGATAGGGCATDATRPLAVDAAYIVKYLFPGLGLRTWRAWDASGRIPPGFKIAGSRRVVWRVGDLKQWTAWEFPGRVDFEERQATVGVAVL